MRLKYGSVRTYSHLCEQFFASKAETIRAEELRLLEMAGGISDLQYQKRFVLSKVPRITITIDFCYKDEDGKTIYEDTKGILTRDFRVKMAWAKEKFGIDIVLTK